MSEPTGLSAVIAALCLFGAACASGATLPPQHECPESPAPAKAPALKASAAPDAQERPPPSTPAPPSSCPVADAVAPPSAAGVACPQGESALRIWTDVLKRESAEGHPRENVTFKSDRDRATLEIFRDGQLDDSVAATQESYELRWDPLRGWLVVSCNLRAVRCYRGAPHAGRCP